MTVNPADAVREAPFIHEAIGRLLLKINSPCGGTVEMSKADACALGLHIGNLTQQAEAHARNAAELRETLTTIRDSTFRSAVTLRSMADRALAAMQEPQP